MRSYLIVCAVNILNVLTADCPSIIMKAIVDNEAVDIENAIELIRINRTAINSNSADLSNIIRCKICRIYPPGILISKKSPKWLPA